MAYSRKGDKAPFTPFRKNKNIFLEVTPMSGGLEKNIAGLLRTAGLRVTFNRVEILKFLIERGRPLSHADIFEAMPEMDRVTLYRTLSSLVKGGVAH
jgi:Fe2+ or Zn2+ uptake regulation protein